MVILYMKWVVNCYEVDIQELQIVEILCTQELHNDVAHA